MTRLFVAGSTGATGRRVLELAQARNIPLVAHVRPRSAAKLNKDPRAAVFELSDTAALVQAMSGCTAVLQLIGTIRKRISQGDTYQSSDVETTRQLVEAARSAKVPHLVLLSSVGAGKPLGAYLKAKAEAEQAVTESGLSYTVFRPSAFMGDRHHVPAFVETLTRALSLDRYRPIPLGTLATALLQSALTQGPKNEVLEGSALWGFIDKMKSGI